MLKLKKEYIEKQEQINEIQREKADEGKIQTINELRVKTWYKLLRIVYIGLYITVISGLLKGFTSGLENLEKANSSISNTDLFWILCTLMAFFLILYIIHQIIKRGFYFIVFGTIKPDKG
ncbi:MAG: hypothetical protein NTX82_03485 [Candidatus Parcubacteria bacterium]|nr:hypothetical protein [Candidatus Parcubacteria bacterium]